MEVVFKIVITLMKWIFKAATEGKSNEEQGKYYLVYVAIVFGIFAIPAIFLSGIFRNPSQTTSTIQPTWRPPKLREPIFDDSTVIRRYAAGQDVELTYESGNAHVATLRIFPAEGKFIAMSISEVEESAVIREIDVPIMDDGIAELCGYEFRQSKYMITFEAPQSGDYTITLKSGNTCEGQ